MCILNKLQQMSFKVVISLIPRPDLGQVGLGNEARVSYIYICFSKG